MRRRAFVTMLATIVVAGCTGSTDENAEGDGGRGDEATSTPMSTPTPTTAPTITMEPETSPPPTTKPSAETATCTITGGRMFGYTEVDSGDVTRAPVLYANLSASDRRLFDRLRERFVKGGDLSVSLESVPDVVVKNGTYYRLQIGYWDRFC